MEEVLDGTYAPVEQALPVGGSSGQVPVRTSSGVTWATVSGGGTIPTVIRGFSPAEMNGGTPTPGATALDAGTPSTVNSNSYDAGSPTTVNTNSYDSGLVGV